MMDLSNHVRKRQRFFRVSLALLLVLPSLLMLGALLRGAIPNFMDTVMYFYPLRVHAARLLGEHEWPLWNRCIMGGTPLFENPQAALAYPFTWPFLARPGGFWFLFPMTLQLGLAAALTGWAMRRVGVGFGPAVWSGALVLAGSYGWSRLQFGNYMNVLPWWPLWVGAAHAWVRSARRGWLLAGSAAVAMMLCAGAHQLAAYGLLGLLLYGGVQSVGDARGRGRWLGFGFGTVGAGVLLAAPGWLPQLGFMQQTARAGGLETDQVLAGAIGSAGELVRALVGDWERVTLRPRPPWADAEGSAALGLAALALAALMPARRPTRRAWLALWLGILLTVALSLQMTWSLLMRVSPCLGLFHDPRRILGITQWLLVAASGLGLHTLIRETRTGGLWPRWTFAVVLAVCAVCAACLMLKPAPWVTTLHAGAAALVLALPLFSRLRAARWIHAMGLLAALGLLGHATWTTTDLAMRSVDDLTGKPLITQAGLEPGQRYFTLDWHRAASYDYRRPDLSDWALPNLSMLWGLEDLGGYEPAQSRRYRAFMRRLHLTQPYRRPYPQHFGLVQNPMAIDAFEAANVRAAVMPRWGVPLFAQRRTLPDATVYVAPVPEFFDRPFSVVGLFAGEVPASGVRLMTPKHPGPAPRLGPPHQLEPADDLALDSFGGSPPPSPAHDHLQAARSMSPLDPRPNAVLGLSLPSGTELIDLFAWSEAAARRWRPRSVASIAAFMEFTGEPAWIHWRSGHGRLIDREIHANRIALTIEVTGTGKGGTAELVVHDAGWPGWHAELRPLTPDGPTTPLEIEPEGLWRCVRLPAGRQRVVMHYRPASLSWALWLMILGGVVLLVMWSLADRIRARQATRKGARKAPRKRGPFLSKATGRAPDPHG